MQLQFVGDARGLPPKLCAVLYLLTQQGFSYVRRSKPWFGQAGGYLIRLKRMISTVKHHSHPLTMGLLQLFLWYWHRLTRTTLTMSETLAVTPDYARYYKQQLSSDCDLIITWPAEVAGDSYAPDTEPSAMMEGVVSHQCRSCSLPAHQLVLCNSKHFEAQAQRWQTTSISNASDTQQQNDAPTAEKPKISMKLSIDSKEQLPAAEAVIAALYGVEGCFHPLEQDQLLHALVIADMIDLPEVVKHLQSMLNTAAGSNKGFTAAALNYLADLSAWPDCLHQLLPAAISHAATWPTETEGRQSTALAAADEVGIVQRILLAAYGDLQAVWQNAALIETLMQLPLPAMQLLLGSDSLQVPSEDTVLHAARQYIAKQQGPAAQDAASAALLPLVRAPLLSDLALHLAALRDISRLGKHEAILATELWSLITLQRITQGEGHQPRLSDIEKISEAPKSWLLSPRRQVRMQPAVVVWKLPVEQLKASCMKAAEHRIDEVFKSPMSPPLGVLSWFMVILCRPEETGVQVEVLAGPSVAEPGLFFRFTGSIGCSGHTKREFVSDCLASFELGASKAWGLSDHFDIGPMAGGWDAAAWAAKGLPASGDLVFELKVEKAW